MEDHWTADSVRESSEKTSRKMLDSSYAHVSGPVKENNMSAASDLSKYDLLLCCYCFKPRETLFSPKFLICSTCKSNASHIQCAPRQSRSDKAGQWTCYVCESDETSQPANRIGTIRDIKSRHDIRRSSSDQFNSHNRGGRTILKRKSKCEEDTQPKLSYRPRSTNASSETAISSPRKYQPADKNSSAQDMPTSTTNFPAALSETVPPKNTYLTPPGYFRDREIEDSESELSDEIRADEIIVAKNRVEHARIPEIQDHRFPEAVRNTVENTLSNAASPGSLFSNRNTVQAERVVLRPSHKLISDETEDRSTRTPKSSIIHEVQEQNRVTSVLTDQEKDIARRVRAQVDTDLSRERQIQQGLREQINNLKATLTSKDREIFALKLDLVKSYVRQISQPEQNRKYSYRNVPRFSIAGPDSRKNGASATISDLNHDRSVPQQREMSLGDLSEPQDSLEHLIEEEGGSEVNRNAHISKVTDKALHSILSKKAMRNETIQLHEAMEDIEGSGALRVHMNTVIEDGKNTPLNSADDQFVRIETVVSRPPEDTETSQREGNKHDHDTQIINLDIGQNIRKRRRASTSHGLAIQHQAPEVLYSVEEAVSTTREVEMHSAGKPQAPQKDCIQLAQRRMAESPSDLRQLFRPKKKPAKRLAGMAIKSARSTRNDLVTPVKPVVVSLRGAKDQNHADRSATLGRHDRPSKKALESFNESLGVPKETRPVTVGGKLMMITDETKSGDSPGGTRRSTRTKSNALPVGRNVA